MCQAAATRRHTCRQKGVSAISDKIHDVVEETQRYYDGPADEVYRRLWQDNVHMGTWTDPQDTLQTAMERTNHLMAQKAGITRGSEVLDVGCGYGAAGFFLAREYGCKVVGQNISEKELDLARERAKEQGLDDVCTFEYGDFHAIPSPDSSFDFIWSQEAFLHGADKRQILRECHRVLRPNGKLIISDLLVRHDVGPEDREAIYARVRSPEMWDYGDYRDALKETGFRLDLEEDWSANVAPTYGSVLSQLKEQRTALAEKVPEEQLNSTINALQLWVDSANAGKISQGFFVATAT